MQPPNGISGQQQQMQQAGQAQLQSAQLMAAQQQQMANLQQMQQQKNESMMKGQCLLKLMQFNEHLSGPGPNVKDDLAYWQGFVNQFFSQGAVFRLIPSKAEAFDYVDGSKHHDSPQFDIPQVALARFFQLSFEGGIRSMALILGKGTVDKVIPGMGHYIENGKSSFIQWMDDSHVVWHGSLRVQFDGEQKLSLFEFNITNHDEFLAHTSVLEAAKPSHEWGKQWKSLNEPPGGTKSPEMSKKAKPKTTKSPPGPPPDIALSETVITRQGVPKGVSHFLEVSYTRHFGPLPSR